MKSRNKRHNLVFTKSNVVELNKERLRVIHGGTGNIVGMTPYITTITDIPNISKNTLCTSDAH